VDVLFIGPADLGLRYRERPDPTGAVEEAVQRVAEVARRHGKHWGITAASAEIVRQRVDQGARLLGFGSVFGFVYQGLRRVQQELPEWLG
jgi:2-keto-3-deoxy-L-rhamnonate aldolase RhmA